MDWFKMQMIWGASVERLSDAEAGRFIKAVYAFARNREEYHGGGKEEPTVFQALETLRKDMDTFEHQEALRKAKEEETREKRRAAANARWMQKHADECKCIDGNANASTCMDMDANASENKNKNKNKNKRDIKENPLKGVKENRRFSPPTVEEVSAYCQERGNSVDPQRFVDFYVSKGWKVGQNPMKDWKAAVRTWEQREGEQRKKPAKVVSAQQYEQRQYAAGELDSIGDDLIDEVRRQRDGSTGAGNAVPVGPDADGALAGTGADASYSQWGW